MTTSQASKSTSGLLWSKLSELDLSDEFRLVEVRDHRCGDPIEKL